MWNSLSKRVSCKLYLLQNVLEDLIKFETEGRARCQNFAICIEKYIQLKHTVTKYFIYYIPINAQNQTHYNSCQVYSKGLNKYLPTKTHIDRALKSRQLIHGVNTYI